MRDLFKNYIFPVATLTGSIIGVGFLSLPYITLKVGVAVMLFYFIVMTALVAFIHVIFGKVSLKTPDFKRWPGFVGFYFGPRAKKIVLVSWTLGIFGVMLVYLIVGSQFLSVMLGPIFGLNMLTYALFYFLAASTFIYLGVKAISRIDFLALGLLLVILFLVFLKGGGHINLQNLNMFPQNGFHSLGTNLFLPFGALLFSLWGASFIPEIEEMVRGNKKSLKGIIIASIFIAAIFYFLFTFLILSITGGSTTESALVGLKGFLGEGIAFIALSMGVITTFIAFVAQGLLLKKIFIYDLKLKHFTSFVFACSVPLILFLLGFNSFIPLISFIGGFLLSIDGILILLMYRKIGGKKIIAYPLMLIFILSVVYEVMYFVK